MMKKMDIFAAGVTLCILLTGCEPFPVHSSKAHLQAVNDGCTFEGRHWVHVSNEAKELLRLMMHPAAKKRPTALECLQSKWLTSGHSISRNVLDEIGIDEELAQSFRKSVRTLRKNDIMYVAGKDGKVQQRTRVGVVEDTLADEPSIPPPGPSFTPRIAPSQATIPSVQTIVSVNSVQTSAPHFADEDCEIE
jgi:serine/threonine protein kinase